MSNRATSFTTRQVSDPQRHALWTRLNSESLIPVNIRVLDGRDLEATQRTTRIGDVRVSEVRASRVLLESTTALIAAQPLDSVALFLPLSGEGYFVHDDTLTVASPRQILLHDPDQPFARGFPGGVRELVIVLPKALLQPTPPIRPRVLDCGEQSVPERQRLFTRLEAQARTILAGSRSPTQVEDLVGVAKEVLTDSQGEAARPLSAARRFIENNARNPHLVASDVADAIHVSERQLHRLFASEDSSVHRYLTQCRIDLALEVLSRPDHADIRVGELALRCGFTSHSTFSRVFRKSLGMTPAQWRRSNPPHSQVA